MADGELLRALNAHLLDDLAATRVERVAAGFHARYDARWREYRYRIWAGPPQPLARGFVWRQRGNLVGDEMDAAARRLIGERDFAAVAGSGEGVPWSERRDATRGTVRRVARCSCQTISPWWGEPDDGALLEVRIVADGFLPRMVRNIVALLADVGHGKHPVDWIDDVLSSGDRRKGGGTAPPHGLTLWRVGYGTDEPEPDPATGV